MLEAERGKNPMYCFTYRGEPIGWDVTNTAWHTALRKAEISDFRFHDLRHTWASWHRQAGTSCDELKDLGGWKTRSMVDRYAKFATENLSAAAARIISSSIAASFVAAQNVSSGRMWRNAALVMCGHQVSGSHFE